MTKTAAAAVTATETATEMATAMATTTLTTLKTYLIPTSILVAYERLTSAVSSMK